MSKKYLDTKSGSLEEKISQIAKEQPTIKKPETNVKLEAKTYFDVKEGSLAAAAAKVVSEGLIKEEKFKADYTIEKRAPRHISDEEDESESYGSITVSAKDAGEAKKKIEDEIDNRIDKMKKNPNLKGYSFEGYIDGSVQKISEATEYQTKFKKELEKTGKSVAQMSDAEKKAFFNKMDTMHKAKNETHTWTKNVIYKKQKATGGEKEVINPIKEGTMDKFHKMQKDGKSAEEISKELGLEIKSVKKLLDEGRMKDIATNQSELERLTKRLSDLRDKKKATSDKDASAKLAKDILQTQKSVADLKLSMREDAGDTPDGGIYALRAIKAKRLRLQGELENLDKKDPNYQQKADNLKKQIETQREIMRNKQRAVFTSYDPTLKNEAVKEPYAVGMAQAKKITGDEPPLKKSTITKAHDIAKAIMKKEQAISQQAVNKFHTKLDKLVHKAFGHSSDEKKMKKETKSFKEIRQKMNAQKDAENDTTEKGKTMTGQPLAKIDTEPKTKII